MGALEVCLSEKGVRCLIISGSHSLTPIESNVRQARSLAVKAERRAVEATIPRSTTGRLLDGVKFMYR